MGYTRAVRALLLHKGSPRSGLALGEKVNKSLGCEGTSWEQTPDLLEFVSLWGCGSPWQWGLKFSWMFAHKVWHLIQYLCTAFNPWWEGLESFFYEPLARTLQMMTCEATICSWYPVALSHSRKFTSSSSICDTSWAPEVFSVCITTQSAVVLEFSHPQM